ncbi:MAG: hypothetical protein HQL82_08950 [Magnetococcales bacterium]|nr:hypothetical protein [Magnetococcales bacterium]
MATYTLNVGFTNADLQLFYATGTNLIIAKPAQGGSTPNVAWLVVQPMQANQVTWDEQYGVYASTSDMSNGATLTKMSSTGIPAVMGRLYDLSAAGTIDLQPNSAGPNSFTLLNQYQSPKNYMTVGLYQNANVNSISILGNAISAVPVITNYTAVMTPFTTVYLWMQSQVKSNSVVTTVTSTTTQVTFGGGVYSANMQYNSSSGSFIQTSANEAMLAGSPMQSLAILHHIAPRL